MEKSFKFIDETKYEVVDSKDAKIISEVSVEYENDEEITKPESTQEEKILIGFLNDDVLILGLSKKNKDVYGMSVIKKENILFVAESIEKLLNEEKPWEKRFEFKESENDSFADNIEVLFISSWSHNLIAPFERIVIRNRRKYVIDDLRSNIIEPEIPIKTAKKLSEKLKEIFNLGA
jgi:hypothetical protein